jgi:hypothetical protein
MNRRNFLSASVLGAVGAGLPSLAQSAETQLELACREALANMTPENYRAVWLAAVDAYKAEPDRFMEIAVAIRPVTIKRTAGCVIPNEAACFWNELHVRNSAGKSEVRPSVEAAFKKADALRRR